MLKLWPLDFLCCWPWKEELNNYNFLWFTYYNEVGEVEFLFLEMMKEHHVPIQIQPFFGLNVKFQVRKSQNKFQPEPWAWSMVSNTSCSFEYLVVSESLLLCFAFNSNQFNGSSSYLYKATPFLIGDMLCNAIKLLWCIEQYFMQNKNIYGLCILMFVCKCVN